MYWCRASGFRHVSSTTKGICEEGVGKTLYDEDMLRHLKRHRFCVFRIRGLLAAFGAGTMALVVLIYEIHIAIAVWDMAVGWLERIW